MKNRFNPLVISMFLICAFASHAGQAAQQSKPDFGGIAVGSAAGRTIVILPSTKWANVANGETITFVIGNQHFTFHFDASRGMQSVSLRALAPSEMDVPDIQVYLSYPPSDA